MLKWFGVRFLIVSVPNRIGHLVAELDHYIRLSRRGDWGHVRPVMLLSRRKQAHRALLARIARHVAVIRSRPGISLLRPFERYPFLQIDLRKVVMEERACRYHAMRAMTARDPPTLVLSADDVVEGGKLLRALGVSSGRWIVALHCREGGYDEGRADHRNARIDTFRLAVEAVAARGGWCIRMGDDTMSPATMEGLTDYAGTALRSDDGDTYLCAVCRFFIGTNSGLALLPSLFGVPAVWTNLTPLGASLPPDPASIAIPKLVRDRHGRLVPLPGLARSPIANDFGTDALVAAGCSLVENTPEDIRDAVVEMMDRLDERCVETEADRKLQAAFRRLLTPDHYCFHAESRTDYARSPHKSDFMDVYLCGACRMFLGNSSGLAQVATMFGVPIACANMVPLGASLPPAPDSLSIPKLVADADGRVLSFAEMASHPSADDHGCESMAGAGLHVIDNDPEDIRDLALEMLDRLDGTHVDAPDDERRQQRFRTLIAPSFYCYWSAARIGRDFLRRHEGLL